MKKSLVVTALFVVFSFIFSILHAEDWPWDQWPQKLINEGAEEELQFCRVYSVLGDGLRWDFVGGAASGQEVKKEASIVYSGEIEISYPGYWDILEVQKIVGTVPGFKISYMLPYSNGQEGRVSIFYLKDTVEVKDSKTNKSFTFERVFYPNPNKKDAITFRPSYFHRGRTLKFNCDYFLNKEEHRGRWLYLRDESLFLLFSQNSEEVFAIDWWSEPTLHQIPRFYQDICNSHQDAIIHLVDGVHKWWSYKWGEKERLSNVLNPDELESFATIGWAKMTFNSSDLEQGGTDWKGGFKYYEKDYGEREKYFIIYSNESLMWSGLSRQLK